MYHQVLYLNLFLLITISFTIKNDPQWLLFNSSHEFATLHEEIFPSHDAVSHAKSSPL